MTDDRSDLDRRFADLDTVPVPPWREHTLARLDDPSEVDVVPADPGRRRRPVLVAAAAVAALAGVGIALRLDDGSSTAEVSVGDREPTSEVSTSDTGLASEGRATTVPDAEELPLDDRLLVCPPVLLDVSRLDEPVSLERTAPTPGAAEPYELTWLVGGVAVHVRHPLPADPVAMPTTTEEITLADGRTALLAEGRMASLLVAGSDVVVDVRSPGSNELGCEAFRLSASGDGSREVLLDAAERVEVRAPEATVTVPDVVGLPLVVAQDRLARAGLVSAGDVEWSSSVRRIEVQGTQPGAVVDIGTTVVLSASPPLPLDDRLLMCPPALLDLSGLDVDWSLAPGPRSWDGPESYDLRWQQGEVEVRLLYPAPSVRTAGGEPSEEITLADGRMGTLWSGSTLDVFTSGREAPDCDRFQVSATGPGYREVVLSVAEQVHLRVPAIPVAVPEVVGLDVLDAQNVLARAGLVPTGHINFTSSARSTVVDQSPPSGTVVGFGDEVTLTSEAG
ncbi:MAG: PASTA domain-containing protein [Actinomycetota bacterium]|nr:PASTA domain-containing protein [Actinomycetota bacterium]